MVENSQIQLVENPNLTAPALNRFVKPNDISKLVAQYGTRLAKRNDFRVRGRIAIRNVPVKSPPDDFSLMNDHSTD